MLSTPTDNFPIPPSKGTNFLEINPNGSYDEYSISTKFEDYQTTGTVVRMKKAEIIQVIDGKVFIATPKY